MTYIIDNGDKIEYNSGKIKTRILNELWIMVSHNSERYSKKAKELIDNIDKLVSDVESVTKVDGITKSSIDLEIANYFASLTIKHRVYEQLAVRILATRLYKQVHALGTYEERMGDVVTNRALNYVTKINDEFPFDTYNSYLKIIHTKLDYYGISTMIGIYLTKKNNIVHETPDEMYKRVASILPNHNDQGKMYQALIDKKISVASPILFNAGTRSASMISCTLQSVGDSRELMIKSFDEISAASSDASGIGLYIGNIRSTKTNIGTTGGKAMGHVRYVKIINELAKGFDQKGKRKGSVAVYTDIWHADILDVLKLRLPNGEENLRAKDIFIGVMIPDNFYKALLTNDDYYTFCPKVLSDHNIDLSNSSNKEFEELYRHAVKLGLGTAVKPKDIWQAILHSLLESGMPYIINKDLVNKTSNHSCYGTITSSNLCAEILQYHNIEDTTANCDLGAVCVDEFISNGELDTKKLHESVALLTKYLNRVLTINKYSTSKAEEGKHQHAIAIGMVGFADALVKLGLAYDSDEAVGFGRILQANIYYAALNASCDYSKDHGVYKNFSKSNYAKGILEFDHYDDYTPVDLDWNALRKKMHSGVFNSLVVANMPTASTSFLLGKNECFEALNNNIYERENLVGKFVVLNKSLDLILDQLSDSNRQSFIYDMIDRGGSIQDIDFNVYNLDEKYKDLFKIVWEISQKWTIKHASARQKYVDQTQSMNLFLKDPDYSKLSSMLISSWTNDLKTSIYYLRTKSSNETNKRLGIDRSLKKGPSNTNNDISCIGCTV